MTHPTAARVPPRCKNCGTLIKGQEPDNWSTTWWSQCPKCNTWSQHSFSEKENLPPE